MPTLRLSIVVPSLNHGEHIEATLRCLLAQQGLKSGELEVIVVDGGSSDGTIAVLKKYQSDLIQWTSGPDSGQTDALVKGFSRATGEILGWLCSDDLLEPWTVREVIDFFRDQPRAAFVYGDAWWIDRGGSLIRPKGEIPFSWYIWLHDHNYIPQPAAFWRRSLYEEVGGLDRTFDLAMDSDLFARFAKRIGPVHLPRQWARMRSYPEQKNRRFREQSDREDRMIRERLGVSYNNPIAVGARFCMAKLYRVAWKLAVGAYLRRRAQPLVPANAVSREHF